MRKGRSYSKYERSQKKPRLTRTVTSTVSLYRPRETSKGEWKYLDTTITGDMNTTAGLYLLNGLAPGTAANQRVGMKVTIRSIELRCRMTTSPVTGVDQYVRMILVLDRQPNGAVIGAVTDVLLAQSISSPRNLANRKRFKIMMDKQYAMGSNLNAATTPSTLPNMRLVKKYIKRPIITEYNTGVAGTIADISTNSLYLMVFGTEVAGNTDTNLAGYIRIRYTDM